MSGMDSAYSSYGWWLRKSADGRTFTASAFHDFKGTDTPTVDVSGLDAGTATYMGGAAGKYALSSGTGGTNDAGHFTARATLTADFAEDTIKGTIDMFIGADGESRDWEVELKSSSISDAVPLPVIRTMLPTPAPRIRSGPSAERTLLIPPSPTASGPDSQEQGTDGVPAVATGTFYTEFNRSGRMVGGFGANQ